MFVSSGRIRLQLCQSGDCDDVTFAYNDESGNLQGAVAANRWHYFELSVSSTAPYLDFSLDGEPILTVDTAVFGNTDFDNLYTYLGRRSEFSTANFLINYPNVLKGLNGPNGPKSQGGPSEEESRYHLYRSSLKLPRRARRTQIRRIATAFQYL